MSTSESNEVRLAISLKDFYKRDEFAVREEFLVPIFEAAGYSFIGTNVIARGVNLSSYKDSKATTRKFIYPDFVLYANTLPLWIVDAKSPKTIVHHSRNLEQVQSYARRLSCGNVILSNALETYVYRIENDVVLNAQLFTFDEVCGSRWDEFIDQLNPELTVKNILSVQDALRRYQTDDYIERSFLMRILQTYGFKTLSAILTDFNNPDTYHSPRFRSRSLPAILVVPYSVNDQQLFKNIVEFSMNDSDCIVRENLLTCLIKHREHIPESFYDRAVYSIEPQTYLEELLFVTFLAAGRKGRRILRKYNARDPVLRRYTNIITRINPVSFPLALAVNKPHNISYEEFYTYLSVLPALIEKIESCPMTHPETFAVLSYCLSFAKENNRRIYQYLLNMASRKQKYLIEQYSKVIVGPLS